MGKTAVAVLAGLAGCLLLGCGGGPGRPAERPSDGPSGGPANGASPSPIRPPVAEAEGLIVFDGDSLTEGFMLPSGQDYPSQAMTQLPGWLAYVNFGLSGQTWPDLLADVRREVDPLYSAHRRLNLVAVWAGTNDVAYGFTAQQMYGHARSYCEGRRQRGFAVVILTMYPLCPHDLDDRYDATRREYNELLREHWREFADGLVDVAFDARIGDPSGPERSRYFIDAVHLNADGYAVIADCVVHTLRPLVEKAAH